MTHVRFFPILPCVVLGCVLACVASAPGFAACPPGDPVPITSGGAVALSLITGIGPSPRATFFVDGHPEINSGSLPSSAWLIPAGDLDGDAIPDYRVEMPGEGQGGWGDPRTAGCPSDVGHPLMTIVIVQEAEDLDLDHAFDIFEDFNRNGRLDVGEDSDGDGRLTPAAGCEGFLREDVDCDGRIDLFNEDRNGDGAWDPRGEDRDGDRHFDAINEDRNHNGLLDPFEDLNNSGHLDDGTIVDPVTQERSRVYDVYIEDRNCNQVLDDRPFPSPRDEIFRSFFPDCETPAPPAYPYGSLHPSRGAVTVLKFRWDGMAYGLDTNRAGSVRGTQ